MNPSVAHVGIAVTSVTEALSFYRDVLGLLPAQPETADGATIVSLHFGGIDVELLEPSDPHSPVAKFLAKRGPGIHHICYRVPDLDATLVRCSSTRNVRRSSCSGTSRGPSMIRNPV